MREVLTDLDYLRSKLRAVGGPKAELVSREETARGVTIELRQVLPADALPPFVRAVLSGDLVIRRLETWNGCVGRVQSEVDGAPGSIAGDMRLDPDPSGSVHVLQLTATVALPLVGRKIEKVIIDNVGKLMDTEYEFTTQWLRDSASP